MTDNESKLRVDGSIWDSQSITHLRKVTRQSKFDFALVCNMMKTYFSEVNKTGIESSVSVDICRRIFAGDYYSDSTPPAVRPKEEAVKTQPSLADENLSYNQIMEIIQLKEEENSKKQEKVFNRVLSSLKNFDDDPVSTELKKQIEQDTSQILSVMEERRKEKLAERKRQQAILEEKEEQRQLQRQREALKSRYEDNSEDSKGIDPLSSNFPLSSISIDDVPIDLDVTNVNIVSVLDSSEFEAILDELERDIAEQVAPGKYDESQISPELAEVFHILDHAAIYRDYPMVNNQDRRRSYDEGKPLSDIEAINSVNAVANMSSKATTQQTSANWSKKSAHIISNQAFSKSSESLTMNENRVVSQSIRETRRNDFGNNDQKSSSKKDSEDIANFDDEDEDDDLSWKSMRTFAKKKIL